MAIQVRQVTEVMMKKISFTFLLISLFCFGCKKNDSNPISSTEPIKSVPIQELSGQLNNWAYGKSYIAKLESFGTSSIDENGKFNIANLAVPAESQLRNIDNLFDSAAVRPSISDRTARFHIVDFLILSKLKNSEAVYGVIQRINDNSAKDNFHTSYIYVDKTVIIDGTAEFKITHGTWTMTQKYVYNKLSFEKGWNKYVIRQGTYDRNTNTISNEILLSEPSSAVWNYTDPQKIITIQHGTAQAGLKYPLCIDNGYKRSASLYTSSELQTKGSIAKLAWKALTRNTASRPVKIYLKEVEYDSLNTDSLSSILSGATKVFDSSVPLLTSQWNWNEFVMMESFIYSGTKNLLVIVETNYGGSGTADDCYFEYSVMNNCKSMTWSESSLLKLGLGTPSLNRPNIMVTIDPE